MANDEVFEVIRTHLPAWLNAKSAQELFEQLKGYPDNKNYFSLAPNLPSILQGDGWRGFVAVDFLTHETKAVSGFILSNSCDITPANPRVMPPGIVFAPLLSLGGLVSKLRQSGQEQHAIDSRISEIRRQRITNLFYLPEIPGSIPESAARLDDLYTHPSQDFLAGAPSRIFSLSNYGFYVLLL